jgi:hypothetical protein
MQTLINLWRRFWCGMWHYDFAFEPITISGRTVVDVWVLRRWRGGCWEYQPLSDEEQADAYSQWAIK